ncbi:MAG: DUF4238 domain-containing protein [Verrucomicrobiia bacterium]
MAKPVLHFLPEKSYLTGFAHDGLVWLYDREKNEFRQQPTRVTAAIHDYYAVLNDAGEKHYQIEEFLKNIEDNAKPIISKLETGGAVTPKERLDLAHFIALLVFRVPKFEREAEQIADSTFKLLMKHKFPTVEETAEQFRRSSKDFGITPESFFKTIHEEKYRLKGNRNIAVNAMLDQAEEITPMLFAMDWRIAHADRRTAFITTDSPLGYIVPEGFRRTGEPVLGLASDKITKLIPLTQQIALLMGYPGFGFEHCGANRQQVREINIAVAEECERYVIGHEEMLVRSIVSRSKVDKAKPGTRMKVEHIPHPADPMRTFMVARRVPADAPDEPFKIVVEK